MAATNYYDDLERDSLFCGCDVVRDCPADAWGAEAVSLAL
jgi:hypothetical protein